MPKKVIKKWYESKTVWVGIITTLIGIFSLLESQYSGISIFTTSVGVLNIVLRTLTTAPIE